MKDRFRVTKEMSFIISLLISLTMLHSCKGQQNKQDYNPKAIEFNYKAIQSMQQMDYDNALILLKNAIEIDKNYYIAYSNMAAIYISKKQFDKALQCSDKVIKIKPDLAESWTFTGMLYDKQGDSLTALKYYEKSIEIFDDRIQNSEKKKGLYANRFNRAISLILLGKESIGNEEMRKLKNENPNEFMIDEFLKMNKQDYIAKLFNK